MAMTCRSFSYFDLNINVPQLRNRLHNHLRPKHEDNHDLSALIRMDNDQIDLPNNVTIIEGTVFDEFIKTTHRITRNNNLNGHPEYAIQRDPYVDIRSGDFWIMNNGMLINRRKGDRGFVSNTVSHALGIEIKPYRINIEEVANDYPNNWLAGIIDRQGNWQKGTIYGDDLRRDNVIGNELVANAKNQVGGYTQYFGGNTKFKVTRDGAVTVFTDLTNNIELFSNFIRDELLIYFVR